MKHYGALRFGHSDFADRRDSDELIQQKMICDLFHRCHGTVRLFRSPRRPAKLWAHRGTAAAATTSEQQTGGVRPYVRENRSKTGRDQGWILVCSLWTQQNERVDWQYFSHKIPSFRQPETGH
jgi:hypothetical protein